MKKIILVVLGVVSVSSIGAAQDLVASEEVPVADSSRLRVGVHAQLGILTPTGVAGGFVSLSARGFSVMLGGGVVRSGGDGPGWRATVGVSRDFALTLNNSLSVELWGTVGSWSGFGNPGTSFGERLGHWDIMPTGHLHLSHQVRFFDRLVLRSFFGVMTNFGVAPDEGTCSGSCSGPVFGVSTGVSLGVLL